MRVERWEQRAEVPLILLALAFLAAYAWPVLDPRIDAGLRGLLDAVSWTVWVAFAADLLIRLTLAEDRRAYAVRHWYDVALAALPLLRPLRWCDITTPEQCFATEAGAHAAGFRPANF